MAAGKLLLSPDSILLGLVPERENNREIAVKRAIG